MTEKGNDAKKGTVAMLLFLMVGFVFVIFPLFGQNWSYLTGSFLLTLTSFLGQLFFTIGGLMFAWGLISLFCSRSKTGIMLMLMGAVMLLLASYLLGPQTIGVLSGSPEATKGYH